MSTIFTGKVQTVLKICFIAFMRVFAIGPILTAVILATSLFQSAPEARHLQHISVIPTVIMAIIAAAYVGAKTATFFNKRAKAH
jgi:hypothetical protein